jgi:hypothetical protein
MNKFEKTFMTIIKETPTVLLKDSQIKGLKADIKLLKIGYAELQFEMAKLKHCKD